MQQELTDTSNLHYSTTQPTVLTQAQFEAIEWAKYMLLSCYQHSKKIELAGKVLDIAKNNIKQYEALLTIKQ